MDPLTALGLATSVIQFVQFAGKLISESQEAYESASGMSCRNINLENIANDLLNLHHQLLKDASRTPRAKLSAAEEHLQRLTRESIQVAERLIRVVQGLKSRGGNKRWKSVRHALTSAWKQKDIAALQTRLVEIRQQLDTALLICLRERMDDAEKKSEGRIRLTRRSSDGSSLFVKEIKTQHKELLQAIRKYEEKPSEIEMQRFSAQLEATADLSIEGRFCKLILAHLEFTDIQDRYERICPAHRQTFEWIFKESDDGDSTWDNFPIWLSSFTDKNFYWVTGKAGSGKSTLMKHIFDDERTRQHLKVWSKGRRLLSGGFFFWNSGTEIQMSRNGLLRTLLYQILNDHPSLIKQVFSSRWEVYQTIRGGFRDQWIWQELKQAFKILAQDDTICLALFIDGLDEFDGDHEELAEFLLKLSSPRIKICAASRPWLVFEDIFENGPSLLLERLTRKDIQLYVNDAFASNRHFSKLQKLNRALASSLIEELVEKSSGVFLWVNLVTRSLLQGMANADRMSELKRRLASLPMDLEELFEKLLRSLDPFYFSHAAQLVQILKAAPVPPKPLEMSYADDEDPTAAINATIRPLTVSEQAERSETMRRRLNSRCKGLIGVSQYGNSNLERVEFLHRTVKDFFDKPGIWADIIDATPKTFDAYQCWSNSLLMELKTCDTNPDMTLPGDMFRLVQWAIQHVEQCDNVTREWQTAYLDELDKTIKEIVALNPTLGLWSIPECFSAGTCFLDLVFQHGMLFYVQQKVEDGGFHIPDEDLDILLENVVTSTSPKSAEIAKLILGRGGVLDRKGLSTAPTLTPEMTRVFSEQNSGRDNPEKTPINSEQKSWWNSRKLSSQIATKVEGFWSL